MANKNFDFSKKIRKDNNENIPNNLNNSNSKLDKIKNIMSHNTEGGGIDSNSKVEENNSDNKSVNSNIYDLLSGDNEREENTIEENNESNLDFEIPEVEKHEEIKEETLSLDDINIEEVLNSDEDEIDDSGISKMFNETTKKGSNLDLNIASDSSSEKEDLEIEDLISEGIDLHFFFKSGSYYEVEGEENSRCHGINAFIKFLNSREDLIEKLKELIANKNDIEEKDEEEEEDNIEQIDNNNIIDNIPSPIINSDNGISNTVLEFVCKKTIQNLIKTHKSEIYSEKYTVGLFQDYLNDKINAKNPLFKALIDECIEKEDTDEYLGELTKTVLQYISEG